MNWLRRCSRSLRRWAGPQSRAHAAWAHMVQLCRNRFLTEPPRGPGCGLHHRVSIRADPVRAERAILGWLMGVWIGCPSFEAIKIVQAEWLFSLDFSLPPASTIFTKNTCFFTPFFWYSLYLLRPGFSILVIHPDPFICVHPSLIGLVIIIKIFLIFPSETWCWIISRLPLPPALYLTSSSPVSFSVAGVDDALLKIPFNVFFRIS